MKATKLMAIVMIGAFALSLAGCAGGGAKGGKGKKGAEAKEAPTKIEELQKLEGNMLVIESTIRAPLPDDVDPNGYIVVTYDGKVYDSDPYNGDEFEMRDEDYMKIYEFCVEAAKTDKFAGYSEDVCDGMTYKFTYYDEDGGEHVLYDGYCYDNDELNSVFDALAMYSLD